MSSKPVNGSQKELKGDSIGKIIGGDARACCDVVTYLTKIGNRLLKALVNTHLWLPSRVRTNTKEGSDS
jgi:hypothetical protein